MVRTPETSARDRILQIARKLFAENGFSNTSIRDIASGAGVNVAAINYYFNSKESLVFEVLRDGYLVLSQKITSLDCKSNESMADFAIKIFNLLVEHGDSLLNAMKIILSVDCSKMSAYGVEDEWCGPPGSRRLLEVLAQRLPVKLAKQDAVWFVNTVCALLFHCATMVVSPYASRPSCRKLLAQSKVEKQIRRAVDALYLSLRTC